MKKTLSLILSLAAFSQYAFAAPVITGFSVSGGKLTIAGSGFGTKSPAAPLLWADFQAGSLNPSPLGQRKTWSAISNLTLVNGAAQGSWDSVPSSQVQSFSFRFDKSPITKIYHYQKRHYNFAATTNHKFWRLWTYGDVGPNNFVAAYVNGEVFCYNEKETDQGIYDIDGAQGGRYTPNKWLTEEFIWQYSGGTGLNRAGQRVRGGTGIWDYTRDGVVVQHRENVDNGPSNFGELRTDNYTASQAPPPAGAKVLMDNIYIDDTYARVMIGNASTLAASTRRDIQVPSAWTSGTVSAAMNTVSFTQGEKAYLFVVDSTNKASPGYPITIGSTPVPAPTPTPTPVPAPTPPPVVSTTPWTGAIGGEISIDGKNYTVDCGCKLIPK